MTIKDYTVLYSTIQEDLIQVYTGPNRTIQDYTRPFITIHDRTGLCKTIPDYIGLYQTEAYELNKMGDNSFMDFSFSLIEF